MHVRAIVLKREPRLATGENLWTETRCRIGDVKDGSAVAGHCMGLSNWPAVAVPAPKCRHTRRWWRRLLSGDGLGGAGAGDHRWIRNQEKKQQKLVGG